MFEQTIVTSIDLKRLIEEVFDFFMRAENLERLTPPWVKFQILSELPIEMKEGALIDYRIKVRGVWMTWRTRITVWEPGTRFVDEQLRGPYKEWIHEHRFESIDGGTRMTDTVRYILPFGFFGAIALPLVRRDLRRIFQFRADEMARFFGVV